MRNEKQEQEYGIWNSAIVRAPFGSHSRIAQRAAHSPDLFNAAFWGAGAEGRWQSGRRGEARRDAERIRTDRRVWISRRWWERRHGDASDENGHENLASAPIPNARQPKRIGYTERKRKRPQGRNTREGRRDNNASGTLTKAPTAVRNCDCIACRFVNPLRTRIE